MKILILSTDESGLNVASDANARFTVYSQLVDNVDILVLTEKKSEVLRIAEHVTVHSTGYPIKLFNFFGGFWLAVKIIKEKNIDVVITQDPLRVGLLGYLLATYCRIKLVVSVYGSNVFDSNWLNESVMNRIFSRIGAWVLNHADAIQTDGFETVKDLRDIYGEKVFWKPIIPTNINAFKTERTFAKKNVKILFVGRLVRQKNITMLINVIAMIVKTSQESNFKFTVIGRGELQAYFLDRVKKEQLANYVEYIEEVGREQIIDHYQDSDIFILCSNYEGFPKVFMEAAAAGLPIVTTDVSGVANLVRDGQSGFVVPVGDLSGFAAKLKLLIDSVELRQKMSTAARQYFWANYSIESMISQQKKIFDFVADAKADYKVVNVEKYRNSNEREKYSRQASKLSKVDFFKKNIEYFVAPNEKLLDIGGGAGVWTDLIRESGLTPAITAVDISPDVLRERNKLDECVVGDMEALPFADEVFDRAMFFAALHHSDKTSEVLAEAVRVTKKSGHVFFFEPISLKTVLSWKQIKPVDNGAEFAFSPFYFFYHLHRQGLKIEYVHFMGFISRFSLYKGVFLEQIINNIPILKYFFGLFANYVVVVAKKED